MLAVAPYIATLLQKESFAEIVEMCLDEAYGNVSAVSRRLQVSCRTIRDWKQGTQVPQLASLLRLCSILEISPLQVFSSDRRSIGASKGNGVEVAVNLGERTKKSYRVLDVEKVKGKLIAELQQEKDPPRLMSAVAEHLNYDPSFLSKHFPDLCHLIAERYREYRKKQRNERRQKIFDEVQQTTYRIHQQKLYPSHERVRLLLAEPAAMREPGALAIWHETLKELESEEP